MSIRITPLADPERGPSGRRLVWLASDDAQNPVGSAFLRLFARPEVRHLTELEINVHPAERRAGVGRLLLEAAVGAARENLRRRVSADVPEGAPGEGFLAAHGFRPVLTLTFARLPLERVDPAALAAAVEKPHPGYRLVSWDGAVPGELLDTFTASRRAMADMPMGEADFGVDVWDADRVLSAARAIEERGELLHTVAAVRESDGSVVGFTELVVPGDGRGDAQHYGTGVLPEHRGRGLARWMKTEAIRGARERHPGLAGLLTDTADGNAPMRAVNDALGYAPTHRTVKYQLDL
ncbi:GNAT family N-acetyltransferase [Sphaerisporangium sp. NPDC005289]|uniref:GNAT family N-acetyltransferase n=1 Tax=Sphaerisporangium sp. NPDC005289 TaxID=3155247 RepID=UPI0033A601E1